MDIAARFDRPLVRTHSRSTRYLLVELAAPARERARPRPPLNLALVLDRSGSMSGEKLDLARRAAGTLVRQLSDEDRACVVTYDDEVSVVSPSVRLTSSARADLGRAIEGIRSGGSTNLSGGWLEGCRQVAEQQDGRGTIDRALLLTDGLANVGIVDQEELCGHAAELRARGISTSTFGIGADYNEDLLRAMAEKGGGHYFYLRGAADLAPSFGQELGELLGTVARDVTVEVRAPGAAVALLNDVPSEPVLGGVRVRLGDLASREEKSLVVKVTTERSGAGATVPVRATVTFRDPDDGGLREREASAVNLRHADNREVDRQPRDGRAQRATGLLYAARARAESVSLNRAGRYDEARRVLERTAGRIASYAGSDPELLAAVEGLRVAAPEFGVAMAAPALKEAAFESYRVSRSRRDYR